MKVHLHGLMQERGGAAKVARSLAGEVRKAGGRAVLSCEIPESGPQGFCPPQRLGEAAAGADLVHLHGSADWRTCLEGLAERGAALAVTLHDCRPLTGGCPYPLGCRRWFEDCRGCPRGFVESYRTREALREVFQALRPLLVAPSRWMAGMAHAALPGLEIRIVPNGVSWPARPKAKAGARLEAGLTPGVRAVVFAAHGGAAAGYKAGDKWMEIWREASSGRPGWAAFMAGGERDGVDGEIIHLPYLPEKLLRKVLRASDLLVYPTLADNHPLIVLEAMSEGVPVLASEVGGIPEQIEDGVNGFLAPAGDFGVFAAKLARLLDRPSLMARAGSQAHQSGAARFSLERMARGYLFLYGELLRADSRTKSAVTSAASGE